MPRLMANPIHLSLSLSLSLPSSSLLCSHTITHTHTHYMHHTPTLLLYACTHALLHIHPLRTTTHTPTTTHYRTHPHYHTHTLHTYSHTHTLTYTTTHTHTIKARRHAAVVEHFPATHISFFKMVADVLACTGKWRSLEYMLAAMRGWTSSYRITSLHAQSYQQLAIEGLKVEKKGVVKTYPLQREW